MHWLLWLLVGIPVWIFIWFALASLFARWLERRLSGQSRPRDPKERRGRSEH